MSDRYKGAILSPTAPTVTPQSAGGIYTSSQQLQYQGQGVWPSAFNNPINNSLRFRSSASAYLNRTPASASNQKTWTWSGWVKRGSINASFQRLFSAKDSSNDDADCLRFNSGETFSFLFRTTPNLSFTGNLTTTQVFRDPSAWYHIVAVLDTTQATSSNRMKLYVNGTQITSFSTATYPTQNDDGYVNSTNLHTIGNNAASLAQNFDGYLAEVNFIDGLALTPSSFGTTDAYGIWQPIPYTGTYGTNGFYLPFYNSTTLGTSVTASYLMVAGGGAGGAAGGGGGAGGLLTGTTTLNSTANYVVTVGAGGAGGSGVGAQGGNTSFIGLTAIGGGGGAYGTSGISATTGGSGGGGSVNAVTGAAGTSGQGFAGGNGINTDSFAGGGGGGASAVGSNASTVAGGNGGAGTASSISGSSVTYAGGGGGGGYNGSTAGTGGAGGGGNGASSGAGASGTANRGGGGGGGANGGNGGSGGSGVVIVSYAGSQRYVGGTVTSSGGNTIHTFTSSGTLTVIGNDFSGNGNNWTLNNISLTPGTTYDSMVDVPTNTNSNTANYAVMNPLVAGTSSTLSNGNLTYTNSAGIGNQALSSIVVTSGSYYFEATLTTAGGGGTSVYVHVGDGNTYYATNGEIYSGGVLQTTVATLTSGDVVGLAFTVGGSVTYYKNGTSVFTGGVGGIVPFVNGFSGTVWNVNFGQRPFTYTPPTGFNRLNTYNLPTPTILAGNQYFDATTYTGNGGTLSVTNSGSMQPDFVWIKRRDSGAESHKLNDSVRGVNKQLMSNSTDAEYTNTDQLTSFNSNGFTTGASATTNGNGTALIAWQWRASNAAGVSNTQGTITSTVSANTTAGFSIVTWTGNGASSATIGHGLGVAPSMIIVKNRSATWGWFVYNKFLTNPNTGRLQLNLTNGEIAGGTPGPWNNTAPTSTVFSLGDSSFPEVNGSGNLIVAYCFAPVAGYSAFGSYTGNGSADGPFVYLGFRPRFLLIKNSSTSVDWVIEDTSRDPYNVVGAELSPNISNAETTGNADLDILSNGFKIRRYSTFANESGNTIIYMAFAENPFKIARGR
jgi:hypothetical protein